MNIIINNSLFLLYIAPMSFSHVLYTLLIGRAVHICVRWLLNNIVISLWEGGLVSESLCVRFMPISCRKLGEINNSVINMNMLTADSW